MKQLLIILFAVNIVFSGAGNTDFGYGDCGQPPVIITFTEPNPNYRNDTCYTYGFEFGNGGGIRIVETRDTLSVVGRSDIQRDFRTPSNINRGRYSVEFWDSFGNKDTAALRITVPRVGN
jgi:hypothetical protein